MVVFLGVKQITKGRCGFDRGWSSPWMYHLPGENPTRFAFLTFKGHVMSLIYEIKVGANTPCPTPSLYTSQYSACVRAPSVLKTCTCHLQSHLLGRKLLSKGSRSDAESTAMGRMPSGPHTPPNSLHLEVRCEV